MYLEKIVGSNPTRCNYFFFAPPGGWDQSSMEQRRGYDKTIVTKVRERVRRFGDLMVTSILLRCILFCALLNTPLKLSGTETKCEEFEILMGV